MDVNKLIAFTERYNEYPHKDIFDFLILTETIGMPDKYFLSKVISYNQKTLNLMYKGISDVILKPQKYLNLGTKMLIDEDNLHQIILNTPIVFCEYMHKEFPISIKNEVEWLKEELLEKQKEFHLNETQSQILENICNNFSKRLTCKPA